MKVLGNLPIVKATDSDKPFGFTIQDKTSTQEGTPVNSNVMADLLNNFYRLLELAKIAPTNDFDGDSTQYQIIDALKKLPNSMNDIEQVLTLTDTVWSVPLDLSILPNKYFFIARASENYDATATYTFKGIGTDTYGFTSNVFKTGDNILVVIDQSGVRGIALPKKETLVYEAIYHQKGTANPGVQTVFKSEINIVSNINRSAAGVYQLLLTTYTNVFVEVIPIGGYGDDNLNYPQVLVFLPTGIYIDYNTAKDCNRDNAFLLRVTKKV